MDAVGALHASTTTHKLKHIDIEVTKKCNLRCIHCSAQANSRGVELNLDEMKNILDRASLLGLENVGLTGGEPLTRRTKLFGLLSHCKNTLHTKTHLHTNGTLLTPRDAKLLAELADEVTVTLFGSTSETHEKVTLTAGSLEESQRGLTQLLDEHINVKVFIVAMKPIFKEIPQIIENVRGVGCNRIRILSLSPTGRARDMYPALALDSADRRWLSSALIKAQTASDVKIEAGFCTRLEFPLLGELSGHHSCHAAENRVHIDAFGNVFPCTAASGWEALSAGNLKHYELDISRVWRTSPLLQFLRLFHSNPPPKCRACHTFDRCMGGCRVVMYYKQGNVTAIKEACERAAFRSGPS